MTSGTLLRPCADIRTRLIADTVPIDSGRLLTRTLLTAADGATVLNSMPIRDHTDDSYTFVNVINEDNTVTIIDGEYSSVAGRADHPLTGISWFGARAVAEQVGARVPKLAEWQQVIAAHQSRYPWGNEPPSPAFANYDEHIGHTSPVTRYRPSALGFYDLLGNVGEWCDVENDMVDEAPVVGGGWNKRIGAEWWNPRWKWRRIGTVAIGVRLLFDIGSAC